MTKSDSPSRPNGAGASTIAFAQFVMNTTLNGINACFVHYDRASNVFFLLNDAGTMFAGLVAGSATQVSNSQCTLHGVGSGGSPSGPSTLTITYALDFTDLRVAVNRGRCLGDLRLGCIAITRLGLADLLSKGRPTNQGCACRNSRGLRGRGGRSCPQRWYPLVR